MGLHSVSWSVNVSAIDQMKLIEDSLKWIAGEKSSIEITKDKSFHGANQYYIEAKNNNKKDSQKSLERLGEEVLREILELGVQIRVDDNKLFHIRLELSGLVRGEVSLANEETVSSTVKGKFKIESYPGDSTIEVISNLIEELIDSAK